MKKFTVYGINCGGAWAAVTVNTIAECAEQRAREAGLVEIFRVEAE